MKKYTIASILAAFLVCTTTSLTAEDKVAYLGVATTELPDAMKAQLDLTSGIVVADVAEDSPASESLKKHDILTKFNEQLLMNPGQLTSLMKAAEIGDKVSIEFVRIGKTNTTEIVLGEIEAAKVQPAIDSDRLGILDLVDLNFRGEQGNIEELNGLPADIQAKIDAAMKRVVEMNIDLENVNPGDVITSGSTASSTVWNENGVTYKIATKDKVSVVTILKGEDIIFEGPANTKEEMELIPEPFRKKIEDIQGKVGGASGIIINGIKLGEGKVGK